MEDGGPPLQTSECTGSFARGNEWATSIMCRMMRTGNPHGKSVERLARPNAGGAGLLIVVTLCTTHVHIKEHILGRTATRFFRIDGRKLAVMNEDPLHTNKEILLNVMDTAKRMQTRVADTNLKHVTNNRPCCTVSAQVPKMMASCTVNREWFWRALDANHCPFAIIRALRVYYKTDYARIEPKFEMEDMVQKFVFFVV
eukprot:1794493-Amphidinium_carterae.1